MQFRWDTIHGWVPGCVLHSERLVQTPGADTWRNDHTERIHGRRGARPHHIRYVQCQGLRALRVASFVHVVRRRRWQPERRQQQQQRSFTERATFSAVIRTISMTSCARQNPVTYAFVITWELEPAVTTALINGERYFYEYVATPTDFASAARVCTTRSIFGLTGYLANSVDATDNAAISTALGGNAGWIGIGDFVRWSTWRVASGPEMTQLAT
eukprot:PhM_4_TR15619/c0_g3_i1/m.68453